MANKPIARYSDLDGQGVFITGGATGIGADMVRAFHLQNAKVVFIDINAEAGETLCQELQELTGAAPVFMMCDVTDSRALADCIDKAAEVAGGLKVLLNNAANDTRRDSLEVSPEMFDQVVAVNLKHQFFAANAAFKHMKPVGNGSIINFGSVAPRLGQRDLLVYSTCKSAVQGMTRTQAREFGDHGIRVNAIVPGCIITQRQLDLWITAEDEKRIQADQCVHRRLVGDDIAQMALFLASDVSGGCSSQMFVVDGGLVS